MSTRQRGVALTLMISLMLSLLLTSCKRNEDSWKWLNAQKEEQRRQEEQAALEEKKKRDEELDRLEAELNSTEPEPVDYTYRPYVWPEEELTDYYGVVEHLMFHMVIAFPELAFDGDGYEKTYDSLTVTATEFKNILQELYDNDYILVNLNTVWTERNVGRNQRRMVKNTLRLPKGKKPLVISIDDPCYYESYIGQGFMEKLVLDEEGQIAAYGHEPGGYEVVSRELDAIPILDAFVREHPDFSYNGAKACLSLTGYEGIFGYRTNTITTGMTEEQEAFRASEMEAVKPIIARLIETGWYFGCHTWGHINLSNKKYDVEAIKRDLNRWYQDVGDLVGNTIIYLYPNGAKPDGGDDWHKTGDVFKFLQSEGFRIFCSMGTESFATEKTDISAVICDRLHADGTTLRNSRQRYLHLFDAKEVFDYDVRPDYGYDFSDPEE